MPVKRKTKPGLDSSQLAYETIARRAGIRLEVVKKFIEEHNLDVIKVMMAVGQANDPKFDLVTAVVGKPNNEYFKYIIKNFSNNKVESIQEMIRRIVKEEKRNYVNKK